MSSYNTRLSKKHSRDDEKARPSYADMEDGAALDSADEGEVVPVEEEEQGDGPFNSNEVDVAVAKKSRKKATGTKPSKQRPRKRRAKDPPELVDLDHDAIGLVMAFVGHQELLTLALSSKALRSKLTMSMVVKSAFMGTSQAWTTTCNMKKALTSCRIHVPSPFRLLQVVNVKRCEECNEICVSRILQGNLGRFGLACCDTCRDGHYKTNEAAFEGIVPGSRFDTALCDNQFGIRHDIHTSRRLALRSQEPSFALRVSFYQKICADGEVAGPIVTSEHLKAIQRRLDEFPGKETNEIIDEVLEFDPASYCEFTAAFDIGLKLGREGDEMRLEHRRQVSMKAARNRLANLDSVLEKLRDMLDPSIGDFALNRTANTDFVVTFTCPLVAELLTTLGFVRAPTKVNDATLEHVASTLNDKFEQLQEQDFLSANFLPTNRRFYRQLKLLFHESFPDLALAAPKLSSRVFDLIDKDDLVGAMMNLASFPFGSAEFGSKLLSGLTTRRVRDDRVDMDALTGAYWLVCYNNQTNTTTQAAFKDAYHSFRPTISMIDAFLHWVQAKKKRTASEREDYISALYRPECLRLICEGRFDSAYEELGSSAPLRAPSMRTINRNLGLLEPNPVG